MQKPVSGSTAAPGGPTSSLSPFNPQTATQDLKSAIGIGGSSGGGSGSGGGKSGDQLSAPSYASSALSYSSGSGVTAPTPYSAAASSTAVSQGFAGSPFSPAMAGGYPAQSSSTNSSGNIIKKCLKVRQKLGTRTN